MEFTREQALAALERCLESQERMADQIDAPNLGDLYRSLMVRDDINMLREFAARLREDEKVERVKVPDPVFVHGLLLVQNEDGWWLHHPNGNDYNGPFASESDASSAASLLAARLREDAPLAGKYGDVLAPFVLLMERELRANAHKGDHVGWRGASPANLLLEVHYHVGKLHWALHHQSMDEVREFAADTANMCLMLLDACGLLRDQGEG